MLTGADYVFYVPVKLEQARVEVKVTNARGDTVLASHGVDLVEAVSAQDQPLLNLTIPFVSANNAGVRLHIANFGASRCKVYLRRRYSSRWW